MNDYPRPVRVIGVKREAEGFFTVFVDNIIEDFSPGRFVMLWIPRLDEKPFGISYFEKDLLGITFEVKGRFTKQLSGAKEGDLLGLRGPYGKGFPAAGAKNPLVVGGGCGISPLAPLIPLMPGSKTIIGARSKRFLLFRERFEDAVFMTDDGSFGKKGFVTEQLEKELEELGPTAIVFSCGPEQMMKRVAELCRQHRAECHLSIERYMKCGFGVCGQCMCGDIAVCMEGPVVDARILEKNRDFGAYARTKSGKMVSIKDYAGWRSCK